MLYRGVGVPSSGSIPLVQEMMEVAVEGCLLCGAPCFSEPVSVIKGPMTTRQRIILRSFISRRFQASRGGMAFPVGIAVAIIMGFDAIWGPVWMAERKVPGEARAKEKRIYVGRSIAASGIWEVLGKG